MSKQFAVIGHPIEQSRSPELHHAFAQKTGIDLHYSKRLAPLDGFEANIKAFFAQGGSGMNVTVPFKEQAFAQCHVLTERAKIAKAVAVKPLELEAIPTKVFSSIFFLVVKELTPKPLA